MGGDNGKCPDCGTPYGKMRRCYRCKPAVPAGSKLGPRRPAPVVVSLDADPEIERRKAAMAAEKRTSDTNGLASKSRDEILREAFEAKAREQRERVEAERRPVQPPRTIPLPGSSPVPSRPVAAQATADPEIAVLAAIVDGLSRLGPDSRSRVIGYIAARFGNPQQDNGIHGQD